MNAKEMVMDSSTRQLAIPCVVRILLCLASILSTASPLLAQPGRGGLRQSGTTVSLDPNDDPQDLWDASILEALRHVDVFMPNEQEACRISGHVEIARAIDELRRLVPLLVVKRGSRGASAFADDRSWEVPAYPVKVVDAVGAGDSFDAGFLHGFLRRWPVERSLRFGALTGAWSTTASGGTGAFTEPDSLRRLEDAWQMLEMSHAAEVPSAS
jgi:sugar/nucleoside kinase (ribokinase family)